jgi:hypothetical protein
LSEIHNDALYSVAKTATPSVAMTGNNLTGEWAHPVTRLVAADISRAGGGRSAAQGEYHGMRIRRVDLPMVFA